MKDGWLSDPEENEAVVGIGLLVSVCLNDEFGLLRRLEPFFTGMDRFVLPDGADGNSRVSSSAVN